MMLCVSFIIGAQEHIHVQDGPRQPRADADHGGRIYIYIIMNMI